MVSLFSMKVLFRIVLLMEQSIRTTSFREDEIKEIVKICKNCICQRTNKNKIK